MSLGESVYRSLWEKANDAIFLIDPSSGFILDVNRKGEQLLGYSKCELISDMKHEETNQFRMVENLLNSLEVTIREPMDFKDIPIKKKDGTIAITEISSTLVDFDGRKVLMGIARDVTDRKRAERALRESEERFRAMIEKGSEVILVVGEDGTITYVSPTFKAVLGRNVEEIAGESAFGFINDFVHQEDVDRLIESLSECLRTPGISETVMCRYRHEDGTWHIIEVIGTNRMNDPSVRGVILNIRDITNLKRSEEELIRQTRFLNSVLESLTHSFIVINIKDYNVDLSNSAARSDSPPGALKCYELNHNRKESCPVRICPLRRVVELKRGVTIEHVHSMNDGSLSNVEVHAYPIFDEEGDVAKVIEYTLDIDERKQAEEALRISEQKLRKILDSSPSAIMVTGSDGNIVECNPAALKMFGYTDKSDLIGTNGSFLLAALDGKGWMEAMRLTIEVGFMNCVETTCTTKEGRRFPATVSTNIIRDASDRPSGFVTIIRDITERKRAEKALRDSEERYRTTVESVDAVLYSFAPNFMVTFVSDKMNYFGYSPAQFYEDPFLWLKMMHPIDARIQRERFDRYTKSDEKRMEREYRIISENGMYWVQDVLVKSFSDDGSLTGFYGSMIDITEHKKVEEKLLEKRVIEAKYAIQTILADVIPSLFKGRDTSGTSPDLIRKFTNKVGEALWPKYYVEGMEDDVDATMQAVVRVLNDIGGINYYYIKSESECIITCTKCPWENETKRNPVLCKLTKGIVSSLARRSLGNIHLELAKSMANNDERCEIVLTRGG